MGVEIGACSICILKRSAKDERVVTDGLKRISSPLGRFTLAFIFQPVVGERQAHKPILHRKVNGTSTVYQGLTGPRAVDTPSCARFDILVRS